MIYVPCLYLLTGKTVILYITRWQTKASASGLYYNLDYQYFLTTVELSN